MQALGAPVVYLWNKGRSHRSVALRVMAVCDEGRSPAKFKSLRTFFASKAEKNLPTVSNPPMVHTTPIPGLSTGVALLAPSAPPIPPKKGCLLALELLDKLENNARRIPETLLVAKDDHPLAVFAGNPAQHVTSGVDCRR